MENRDVLAIDFGTANSYYCKCAGDQLSPSGVHFREGRDGLATAILYREGKAPLVGDVAIQEYGDAGQQERKGYTLRAQFKPDIAAGIEARRNARDFLAAVLEEAKSLKLDLDPARREVIFGVPSEAADDFRKALSQGAREAGYGEIRMVDEPKGALLYHVFHKDIPATDALKGLLVVDFGGGTCDFAFMCRGNVQHSWGDMQLGGRLFDDLFFQWLLEANPAALNILRNEGREFYVLWEVCRDRKESFSQSMARDRDQKRTSVMDHRWRIADATWDEFIQRARSYRPSPTFTQFLASIGGSSSKLSGPDAGFNLLEWFRDCLRQGLHNKGIDKSDIRFVILAGGSSQWPFVAGIVREELCLEESRIMRSDRPYAVISEGLAILPALQNKFRATHERLRAELPEFCRQKLKSLVETRVKGVAKDVASGVTRELFDEKLGPMLTQFRAQGGTVAFLKQQVSSVTLAFEPRLRSLVEEKVSVLRDGLPGEVKNLVSDWLGAHGIAAPADQVAIEGLDSSQLGNPKVDVPDFYGKIIKAIAAFTGGIITSVVAMICGGGGTALIWSGPIGWIIGAIIGLLVSVLTVIYGAEKAKQMAEKCPVPQWILKRVLRDKNIMEIREKFSEDLVSAVEGKLLDMQTALEKQVTAQVEKEIEALSEINQL